MRVGLLPGSATWVGGPGTYLSGLVDGLIRRVPPAQVQILLLGLHQLRRSSGRKRRALQQSLGQEAHVPVLARPISPRLYTSRFARLMPDYDRIFGRHDVYHQAHLDVHPAVPGDRLVLTLHDVIATSWSDEGSLLAGAEQLLRRAGAIVTVSETSRRNILQRFPSVYPDRVHAVWNGIDHTAFRPEAGQKDSQLLRQVGVPTEFLLYVGGITERKNVSALVEAHSRLRDCLPDAPPLVLAGPWSSQRLTDVLQHDPGPGVIALGSVPKATVPALMRHAAVVAAPSRDEGFGLPVLEAQACGALVVCSDIPVFREIGGPAPVYSDPTPEGLTSGLRVALEMPTDEVRRRRKLGIDHAQPFTWDRSAAAHSTVYEQVGAAAESG